MVVGLSAKRHQVNTGGNLVWKLCTEIEEKGIAERLFPKVRYEMSNH